VKRWRLINLGDEGDGGADGGLSGRRTRLLLAAPDAGDRTPFRFAVYADIQEKIDKIQDIHSRMNEDPGLRFALLSGDLTTRGTSAQLARFQREMKTLSFPVYATLGNHELGTRDDLFHDFFGRGNFSFTFRGARFTLLDSASATIAPVAYGWLDEWLAAGARSFHLVTMHIPPLDPVGQRGGGFASRLEAGMLVSRLAAGLVDVTIYGHVHSYYAFSNAGIPAYVTGGGGAVPERLDGIGRHYLAIDVDPRTQLFQVAVIRVD
jgi:3',5'-cyclic AMP phosphodiesterase CpdA